MVSDNKNKSGAWNFADGEFRQRWIINKEIPHRRIRTLAVKRLTREQIRDKIPEPYIERSNEKVKKSDKQGKGTCYYPFANWRL